MINRRIIYIQLVIQVNCLFLLSPIVCGWAFLNIRSFTYIIITVIVIMMSLEDRILKNTPIDTIQSAVLNILITMSIMRQVADYIYKSVFQYQILYWHYYLNYCDKMSVERLISEKYILSTLSDLIQNSFQWIVLFHLRRGEKMQFAKS